MTRKYHNHKLQTNPWHGEEEQQNNHETSGRQTKQSNQLSLPHRGDSKTRMDTKYYVKVIVLLEFCNCHDWAT